jgi:hypothetical protein
MSLLVLLALTLAAAQASPAADGLAIAKRFVAAIEGKAEFADADYRRTLKDSEKAALRRFGNSCSIKNVGYAYRPSPNDRNVFVEDYDFVSISMECAGARPDYPIGLSLHLAEGKIRKVETHNADLLKDR